MDANNTAVESSSTPLNEVPRANTPEYQEWRKTGKTEAPVAEPKTPKADPAPAKESSETDPASETGTEKQEQRKRSNAETRLKEILDDLKTAGYSPAELKTLRREAREAAKPAETKAAEKPAEKTETSPADPKAPVKPKIEDFESYEKFEEAKDKYYEDLTDYRVELKERERETKARQAEQQKEVNSKLAEAKARYGDDAEKTIAESAKAVFNDKSVPSAVKALINDSDVMVDVLFTLGSELDEFVALAKSDPGKAIRKLVIMEGLVSQELGKSAATSEAVSRDESGKFVSSKETSKEPPPAKKTTQAPPPPREASGRSGPPADEVETAAKVGDFATFRAAQNRRDIAARQGK
jgi:hypothetical protein